LRSGESSPCSSIRCMRSCPPLCCDQRVDFSWQLFGIAHRPARAVA
jgi:hypothetical protein